MRSSQIPDQIPVWDEKHGRNDHAVLEGTPSPFCLLVEPYFKRKAHILELGCGVGRDAVYFAQKGHNVIATDGSGIVIQRNNSRIDDRANIQFETVDMRDSLQYANNSFDVVYTNLALHYYSDENTKRIVKEMSRVLKQGGILGVACKSYDSLHSEGKEIEENIFESPSGQVIHLFSKEYMSKLVSTVAEVCYLDEIEEEYNGRHSKIIRCIAKNSPK